MYCTVGEVLEMIKDDMKNVIIGDEYIEDEHITPYSDTTLEQLTEMQRLFKPYGQDKPKLLPIVNEDCAVRGITKVYFKSLTSKKVISESKRIASLELWAPDIAGIKVKKKTTKKKTTKKSTKRSKSKKSKSKSPAKDSRNTSRGKKAARAAVK